MGPSPGSGRHLLLGLVLLAPLSAEAQNMGRAPAFDVDLELGVGLGMGGDPVAEYQTIVYSEFRSEPFESTSSLKSGGGVILTAGVGASLPSIPIRLHGSVGYHLNRTSDVEDLDSTLRRYPLELGADLNLGQVLVGYGITHQQGVVLRDDALDEDWKFRDATGHFFQAGVGGNSVAIIGRWVMVSYALEDPQWSSVVNTDPELSGDHFELIARFALF